ncbi:MAG TPA: RNA 2',3'-cyclic phosphodiesterase [Pyrinomonadaceae bacterium]|jgi:2'-5' RNA ligase|nr:RNA 2',3'-cyclic phosphodiesterase [Pyrinomonadaceae bacterium]
MTPSSDAAKQREEYWRVFCAINLAPDTRELVLQYIERLKRAVPEMRASWARAESLHLTLKFLGDIPQTSVERLSNAAARAVAGASPFSVVLEGTGIFPTPRQPRVLWIGINDLSRQLVALHERLEEESVPEGFAREARNFQPHLTIARLRRPEHARALASTHRQMEFPPVEVLVSELLVVRSELTTEGSRYATVSRHQLG